MVYLSEDVGVQEEPGLATGLSLFYRQSTESNTWSMDAGGSQGNGSTESHGRTERIVAEPSLRIVLPAPRDASNSINPLQVWGAVGMLLWLAGLSIMLLCGLISYLLLHRRLSKAVLLRENIYQSEQVCSPFVMGFWHPHIYIPFGLEAQTLELVLAHECYHLKRRDHWVKLAAYLLLSLHWFNPLCWVAFFLMGRDMEMSCDEHVLAEWELSCKPYCNALLSFAANRRSWGPSPLAFGESGARRRIRNALNWKKPGTWVKAVAVGLCLLTVTACGLNPLAELPQQEEAYNTGMIEESIKPMVMDHMGTAPMLTDGADSSNNRIEPISTAEETEGFLSGPPTARGAVSDGLQVY